ncbi:hypothetical protein S245_053943, partial [Arachis hypogaea]
AHLSFGSVAPKLRHSPSNGSSPSRSLPFLLLLCRRLCCHCSIVPLSFCLLPPLPPQLASHEPPPCCCLGFYHMLVSRNICEEQILRDDIKFGGKVQTAFHERYQDAAQV